MNTDYYGDIYKTKEDACYDNKAMMNTALPERPTSQTIPLNITESNKPTTHQTISSSSIRLRYKVRRKHVIDIFIFIVVTVLITLLEYGIIPNTELGFICKDPTISYPYKGDTVSVTTLLTGCILGPLLILILIEFIREHHFKHIRLGTVWKYYQECLTGMVLTLLITNIMKVLVGEQRPHFINSCQPDENKLCEAGTFITSYKCTNESLSNYGKADITRSFPSGHTSISLFVSLYLSYMVHKRVPTPSATLFSKPFLISVCLTWTLICSLSRITDRRHHWWDVLGGAFLGVCGVLYTISILDFNDTSNNELKRTNTNTTVLLEVKNKDTAPDVI